MNVKRKTRHQPVEVHGHQLPTSCPAGWCSPSDFSSWRCKAGSSNPDEKKEQPDQLNSAMKREIAHLT